MPENPRAACTAGAHELERVAESLLRPHQQRPRHRRHHPAWLRIAAKERPFPVPPGTTRIRTSLPRTRRAAGIRAGRYRAKGSSGSVAIQFAADLRGPDTVAHRSWPRREIEAGVHCRIHFGRTFLTWLRRNRPRTRHRPMLAKRCRIGRAPVPTRLETGLPRGPKSRRPCRPRYRLRWRSTASSGFARAAGRSDGLPPPRSVAWLTDCARFRQRMVSRKSPAACGASPPLPKESGKAW